jgi:2',3'-cyclic-nucleotide 2'-phosphodiesterase (5'-nucleotidase family)
VVDKRIARNVGPEIDIIVGGHSHTLLYNGTPVPGPDEAGDTYPAIVEQSNGHKVLIVQASAYSKYLGDITVYFDENGEAQEWIGNPIFMDHNVPKGKCPICLQAQTHTNKHLSINSQTQKLSVNLCRGEIWWTPSVKQE